MYLKSIILLLSWPVLILILYLIVKYVLLKYNDRFENS